MQVFKKTLTLLLALTMVFSLFAGVDLTASAATKKPFVYQVEDGEATITRCDGSANGALTIPDTLGGYPVTFISDYAFEGCEGLTSITLGDRITSIGDFAFLDCTKLKSIIIPNSVTSIGDFSFYGCEKLNSITIPNGVTSIGTGAFANCISLTNIAIPDNVTFIGSIAFSGCISLTSITVDSGNTVYHSIGNCLIETSSKTLMIGCKTSVIPTDGSVTSIGTDAFYLCRGLTGITLPKSVTSICESAFQHCTGLTSITIPNSVISIGQYAFDDCRNLQDVYYGSTQEQWYAIKIKDWNESLQDANIHFIDGTTSKVTYAITYKLDGGKNNSANPKNYNAPGKEIVLKNPTKTGYIFKGWYSDSKLTKKVTKIAAGSTGNKTFYAKWAKAYTITYKLNSGTNNKSNPKTYTKTDSTITLKNPTRKGYTFKGWYSDAKYKKKVTKISKGSTGNKTLYAKWAKNTYKITYKLNSGKNNAKNPKTYTVTTKTITLKNPTRKGYTFKGWYSDSKYKTKVTKIAKGSTGNKTLYAKWKKK